MQNLLFKLLSSTIWQGDEAGFNRISCYDRFHESVLRGAVKGLVSHSKDSIHSGLMYLPVFPLETRKVGAMVSKLVIPAWCANNVYSTLLVSDVGPGYLMECSRLPPPFRTRGVMQSEKVGEEEQRPNGVYVKSSRLTSLKHCIPFISHSRISAVTLLVMYMPHGCDCKASSEPSRRV